jgi:hypothetical protein
LACYAVYSGGYGYLGCHWDGGNGSPSLDGFMKNRLYILLSFSLILLLVGFPVAVVSAATSTPLPTDTPQVTYTPYDWNNPCNATSVIPTVEAFYTPTDESTSTPCGPGIGSCAGGGPGGGATSTPTPSVTGTPGTPSPSGGVPSGACGDGMQVFEVADGVNGAGYVPDDKSGNCALQSTSTILCTFTLTGHFEGDGGRFHHWQLKWAFPNVPTDIYWWAQVSGNVSYPSLCLFDNGSGNPYCAAPVAYSPGVSTFTSSGVQHPSSNSHNSDSPPYSYLVFQDWMYHDGTGSFVSNSYTVTVRLSLGEGCIGDMLPTSTPVPAQCAGYSDNSGVVPSSPVAEFNPPHLVHGSCYWVLYPNTIPLPDLSWSPFELPSTIEVYGWQICVDYYEMSAKFGGIDWVAAVASIISLICVAGAYMTLKNMN